MSAQKQLVPLDMGAQKVTNVADPAIGTDAATKRYVDANVGIIPTIGSLTIVGHSWWTNGGSGDPSTMRKLEGMVGRLISDLRIAPTEVQMLAKAGTLLTEQIAMPFAGWATIMQLCVAPMNLDLGLNNVQPSAPYNSAPGIAIMGFGVNDGRMLPSQTDAQRNIYRAYPHAVRASICRLRSGPVFEDSHSTVTYSGFGTTVTSALNSGSTYRKSQTNGDFGTITLPTNFPGGIIDVQFLATSDGYSTLASTMNAVQTTCVVANSSLLPPTGTNYVIQVDGEQMLVTANNTGTNTLTVQRGVNNGGTGSTHTTTGVGVGLVADATATFSSPDGLVDVFTGSAIAGSVTLAAQGSINAAGFAQVPVVKRIKLTGEAAGKRIVFTVGGLISGNAYSAVNFDCWSVEPTLPRPVVVVDYPVYDYPATFGAPWDEGAVSTDGRAAVLNALTASVVAEFDSAVVVASVAADFATKFTAVNQTTMTTGTTSITVSGAGAGLPTTGGFYIRMKSEDIFVKTISGSTWTLGRGANGTTAVTHAIGDQIYYRQLLGYDGLHWNAAGCAWFSGVIRDAVLTLALSKDQFDLANGVSRIDPAPVRSGILVPQGNRTTSTPAEAVCAGHSMVIRKAGVITALSVEVQGTPGSAGALLRLGIYADDDVGIPWQRVLDAGTVAATSTGVKTISGLRQLLLPGRYWFVAAVQGGATTRPKLRCLTDLFWPDPPNFPVSLITDASGGSAPACGYAQVAGMSGAFPFGFFTPGALSAAGGVQTTPCPLIWATFETVEPA